jgi:hypothetical protein
MAEDPKAGGQVSRSGSLTWLWMVLALVSVGGFLTWLGMASEPTSVSVVEDTTDAGMDSDGVPVVSKDTLAANKAGFAGQEIRVHNVAATGDLGGGIFWGELGTQANQVPILIRLDSAAQEGFQTQTGGLYTLTGRLFAMSDSLAGVWLDAGELAGEGERMQASFADYYIQVRNIRPTPASQRESGGSGSGAGGEGSASGTAG